MPCQQLAVALGAALAYGMGAISASAQGGGVNDCTLLTDPTLLRQCVERARQGGNPGVSPSSSRDAFSPHRTGAGGEGTAGAATPEPGAAKGTARGPKAGKRDKAGTQTRALQPRQGRIP